MANSGMRTTATRELDEETSVNPDAVVRPCTLLALHGAGMMACAANASGAACIAEKSEISKLGAFKDEDHEAEVSALGGGPWASTQASSSWFSEGDDGDCAMEASRRGFMELPEVGSTSSCYDSFALDRDDDSLLRSLEAQLEEIFAPICVALGGSPSMVTPPTTRPSPETSRAAFRKMLRRNSCGGVAPASA